jgi:putative membrane protein
MHTLASGVLLADNGHWGHPGWWPVFPLLWLLIIGALVWTFAIRRRRWGGGCPGGPDGVRSGEARLAERFAAGEIDEQEYRARRAVLREKP